MNVVAIVAAHVDDFLFQGRAWDLRWQVVRRRLQKAFTWTDWERGSFLQCNVRVTQAINHVSELSMDHYVKDLEQIPLSPARKKEPESAVTEMERTQLRGLLGGVQFKATQQGPEYSAECGLLQSCVPQAKVHHLLQANKMLQRCHLEADRRMIMHKIEDPMVVGWVDASHATRPDGRSTEGIFIGIGEKDMARGDEGFVSPIVWRSAKIAQVCKSPSAAEAKAFCDAEDEINAVRYQMAEMLGLMYEGDEKEDVCRRIPAVMATDSKNTYDNLQKVAAFLQSKEKMIGVDLAKVQESCAETSLEIRWVNGDAQLANSLTKGQEQAQLNLFYKLGGRWRLVYDETYTSAKKRKKNGTQPLEDVQQPVTELDSEGSESSDDAFT